MKFYIHTFQHARFGHVLRGSAHAHNPLAGIVRSARNAGLRARRVNGSWRFELPAFGFSPASPYILR